MAWALTRGAVGLGGISSINPIRQTASRPVNPGIAVNGGKPSLPPPSTPRPHRPPPTSRRPPRPTSPPPPSHNRCAFTPTARK
ncbi:hypothetical protein C8J57DRAFT_1500412 [Mycena rebaudengoi]|nr:hypothetical protein C8J57DRAFT_1500412 [Mycena rebaudengoi]